MDLSIYHPEIRVRTRNMHSTTEEVIHYIALLRDQSMDKEFIRAFLDCDDIQEMTLCSSNLILTRIYRKRYKGDE